MLSGLVFLAIVFNVAASVMPSRFAVSTSCKNRSSNSPFLAPWQDPISSTRLTLAWLRGVSGRSKCAGMSCSSIHLMRIPASAPLGKARWMVGGRYVLKVGAVGC
ncbi:hypothetical protein BJ741DRAFT_637432 [Chytriomyces cf. hyalinus JEL632]|nr:hypothetical protein BJ741DRAFT_637432 [Chytriomyces cf. hyalinus JEL632]